MQSSIPNVAALVDTATEWGRRLIRGIIRYTRQHGPWFLWTHPSVHALRCTCRKVGKDKESLPELPTGVWPATCCLPRSRW